MPASTDSEAVVTALWPIDGPHRAQDFAQAMLALQLLRYANHATLNASDRVMPDPEDAAVIVRHLRRRPRRAPAAVPAIGFPRRPIRRRPGPARCQLRATPGRRPSHAGRRSRARTRRGDRTAAHPRPPRLLPAQHPLPR